MRLLKRLARRLRSALAGAIGLVDLRDVHIYGGLAIAGYGVSMLSRAIAHIAVGVALLCLGLLAGRRRKSS